MGIKVSVVRSAEEQVVGKLLPLAASDQYLQKMFAISYLSVVYWDEVGLTIQCMLFEGLRPQKRRMLCLIFIPQTH